MRTRLALPVTEITQNAGCAAWVTKNAQENDVAAVQNISPDHSHWQHAEASFKFAILQCSDAGK
jgi:hypothetical protein